MFYLTFVQDVPCVLHKLHGISDLEFLRKNKKHYFLTAPRLLFLPSTLHQNPTFNFISIFLDYSNSLSALILPVFHFHISGLFQLLICPYSTCILFPYFWIIPTLYLPLFYLYFISIFLDYSNSLSAVILPVFSHPSSPSINPFPCTPPLPCTLFLSRDIHTIISAALQNAAWRSTIWPHISSHCSR